MRSKAILDRTDILLCSIFWQQPQQVRELFLQVVPIKFDIIFRGKSLRPYFLPHLEHRYKVRSDVQSPRDLQVRQTLLAFVLLVAIPSGNLYCLAPTRTHRNKMTLQAIFTQESIFFDTVCLDVVSTEESVAAVVSAVTDASVGSQVVRTVA